MQDLSDSVTYTAEQKREFSEYLQVLLAQTTIHQPFFTSILFTVTEWVENYDIPSARTNGLRIEVNPAWMMSTKTLPEGVFVICHEVLHVIYMDVLADYECHCAGVGPGGLPWNRDFAAECMDKRINSVLKHSGVGALPEDALYDSTVAPTMGWEDVYIRDFPKQPPQGGEDGDEEGGGQGQAQGQGGQGESQDGEGQGQGGQGESQDGEGQGQGGQGEGPTNQKNFDQHMHPDGGAAGAPSPEGLRQAVMNARDQAKSQGKMPGELERIIEDILAPQVVWARTLKGKLLNGVGRSESSFRRLRRKPWFHQGLGVPGPVGHSPGTVIIMGDTSGSMGDHELTVGVSETVSIIKHAKPKHALLWWADVKPYGPYKINTVAQLMSLKPEGGGGTRLDRCIDEIAEYCRKHKLVNTTLVIFTDGYTGWPDRPAKHIVNQIICCSTTSEECPIADVNLRLTV